ncbi:NACHT domain-containing protein [Nocardia aurea]|uniref:NACHT domain-containing protein n=1 Tax=Nocardia aurea TaxID=2144174 RepID=UPI00130059DC|nr:hypothetical protein [Nocardia aurea]
MSDTEESPQDPPLNVQAERIEKSIFGPHGIININNNYIHTGASLHSPTDLQLNAARELRTTVEIRCKRERAALQLDLNQPMPVRWSLTKRQPADRLVNAFGGSGPFTFDASSEDAINAALQFQKLARNRLVVLGESGAGKTVFAETLTWGLLDQKTMEVIPVFLRANSWNITEQESLRDWIIYRLTIDYPEVWRTHKKTSPGELYDANLILPVIDGLDEVKNGIRPDIVAALNQHVTSHDGLVISCRTETYSQLVDQSGVIACAAVIEAHPLTAGEAADYLVAAGWRDKARWLEMKKALIGEYSQPLSKICSNPLGLWLVCTIYIRNGKSEDAADPLELLDTRRFDSDAKIQHYLFDRLVSTVLKRRTVVEDDKADPRRPETDWEAADAEKWLMHLAHRAEENADIDWWRLFKRRQVMPRTLYQLLYHAVYLIGYRRSLLIFLAASALGFLAYMQVPYFPAFMTGILLAVSLAVLPIVGVWSVWRMEAPPVPASAKRVTAFIRYEIKQYGLKGFVTVSLFGGIFGGFFVWCANQGFSRVAVVFGWMIDILPADLSMIAVVAIWAAIGVVVAPLTTLLSHVQRGVVRWIRPRGHDSGCPMHSPGLNNALDRELWDGESLSCVICGWSCNCPSCESIRNVWIDPVSTFRVSRIRSLAGIPANILYLTVSLGLTFWFLGLSDGSATLDSAQVLMKLPLMLIVALPFAVPLGITLTIVREPAWFGYFFASRWFAMRNRLPRRSINFLEDMHRVGLFRISGAAYQFRHIELQRYLLTKALDDMS